MQRRKGWLGEILGAVWRALLLPAFLAGTVDMHLMVQKSSEALRES
jgi:hypothetical protein